MTRWYRAYEGTVTDAKLGEVALVAGCSRSVAIAAWHCILESAASSNSGGVFDATPRRIAVILGEQPALIEAVFAELTALGMVSDGKVAAWSKRQYESDSSTERSRKSRQQSKAAPKPDCNGDATLQQQHATPPETETETETELANASARDDEGEAFKAYRDVASDLRLAIPESFATDRRRKMTARLKECGGLDGWFYAMSKIRGSPFLRGETSGFQCTLDFVLQKTSFRRLMEGNYDDRPRPGKTSKPTDREGWDMVDAVLAESKRRENGGGQAVGEVDPLSVS